MNESTRAFTTALDCKHSAENHESDDTCWQCTMKIVDLTKDAEKRAEAAEASATELAAQLATARSDIESYRRMVDALNPLCKRLKNENDEYGGRLSEMTEEIMKLRREIAYLHSTDHAADIAFERTAPLDWRDSEVTP